MVPEELLAVLVDVRTRRCPFAISERTEQVTVLF